MDSLYLVIKFHNSYNSYRILGTYLTKDEANSRIKSCASNLKTVNTSLDTYYIKDGLIWIKKLNIGDNNNLNNYITSPDSSELLDQNIQRTFCCKLGTELTNKSI